VFCFWHRLGSSIPRHIFQQLLALTFLELRKRNLESKALGIQSQLGRKILSSKFLLEAHLKDQKFVLHQCNSIQHRKRHSLQQDFEFHKQTRLGISGKMWI